MVSIGHGLESIMDLLMNGVLLISALEIYLLIIFMFDQVLNIWLVNNNQWLNKWRVNYTQWLRKRLN